jgi:CRP-like cAMP-binding protein
MIDELPQFRLVVQRYTQSFMNLMGQSVACNRLHNLTERAARWLLMARDRVQGNEFYLTHEFLAYMLGVRRSGVTVAAGTLSQAGLIAYKRGKITILDPAGLEATACECYRIIVEDFERVFEMTRRDLDEHDQSISGSM